MGEIGDTQRSHVKVAAEAGVMQSPATGGLEPPEGTGKEPPQRPQRERGPAHTLPANNVWPAEL